MKIGVRITSLYNIMLSYSLMQSKTDTILRAENVGKEIRS